MAWSLTLLLSIAVIASAASAFRLNPLNYRRQNIRKLPQADLDYPSQPARFAQRSSERFDSFSQNTQTNTPEPIENIYKPKPSKSCEHLTFCETDLAYPQEQVDKIIEELQRQSINKSLPMDVLPPGGSDYADRVALPSDQKINLCPTTSDQLIFPKTGIDEKGCKVPLVNRDRGNNPVQGFRVSICEKSGCQCGMIERYAPGYNARCLQYYIYREATAFRMLSNGKLDTYSTQIRLPSHCACTARSLPTTTTVETTE